jgi:hypothetical protein
MKKLLAIVIIFSLFSCSSEYEKRNDKVYFRVWSFGQGGWNDKVVENADLKSFSEIKSDENLYGKDESNVYYENEIIPGADPNTFKHLKEGFAIDKNRAYYYNDSIANSSQKKFEIIDGYYSKDWKNVFYTDKSLNVCSVNDFSFVYKDEESFLGRWSTDGCYYYFNNYKVPSNDYKNIELFKGSDGISKDSEFVFNKDQKYISPYERMVYTKEKGIIAKDTIDIKTFTVEQYICKDKFGRIN